MDCAMVSPTMLASPTMLSPTMLSLPTLVESPTMLSARITLASPTMLTSPITLTSPTMDIAALAGAALVSAQLDRAARTWPVTSRCQVAS